MSSSLSSNDSSTAGSATLKISLVPLSISRTTRAVPVAGSASIPMTSQACGRPSSAANQAARAKRVLTARLQRPKPRNKPMPPNIRRGNATRGKVRAAVDHVFVCQKQRLRLVVLTVGLARAHLGMSVAECISAATINAACALGVDAERGTLHPGKRADLLGVAGNPVENIEAIAQTRLVMAGGRLAARSTDGAGRVGLLV